MKYIYEKTGRYFLRNRNFDAELLYFGHAHTTGTALHCHSYFQLEYCINGQLAAYGNGEKLFLNAGDYWLIPPGFMHKFYSGKKALDYISIKFSSPTKAGSELGHDPVEQYYLEKIRAVLDGETGFSAYSSEGKSIIENHLSGFLHRLDRTSSEPPRSEFEVDLQSCICESGAASNINELAEEFKLSRAEFKYRFLQETGSGKIKEYIDSILLNIAEQHLRYSDTPLNKIAQLLHFSSIYAFSRYFKHHRGITPSEFRRRGKETGR